MHSAEVSSNSRQAAASKCCLQVYMFLSSKLKPAKGRKDGVMFAARAHAHACARAHTHTHTHTRTQHMHANTCRLLLAILWTACSACV